MPCEHRHPSFSVLWVFVALVLIASSLSPVRAEGDAASLKTFVNAWRQRSFTSPEWADTNSNGRLDLEDAREALGRYLQPGTEQLGTREGQTSAVAGSSVLLTAGHLTPLGRYTVQISTPGGVVVGRSQITASPAGEMPSLPAMDLDVPGTYTVEIRDAAGALVSSCSLPVTDNPGDPASLRLETSSGAKTCAFQAGASEAVCVSGKRFAAGSQVDLYVVYDQFSWATGTTLTDVVGGPKTVTVNADGTLPHTVLWANAVTLGGKYEFDVVADTDRSGTITSGDVVNDGLLTGFVVQAGVGSSALYTTQLACRAGSSTYVDTFETSDTVHAWWNPSYKLNLGVGTVLTVPVYVVAHKDTWQNGDPLVDVTEGVEEITVRQWCSNGAWTPGGNLIWGSPKAGVYDVVLDVNRNGVHDSADVLDGGATGPGFEVLGPQLWTVQVSPASLDFGTGSGPLVLHVAFSDGADHPWSLTVPSWVHCTPLSGSNAGDVVVTLDTTTMPYTGQGQLAVRAGRSTALVSLSHARGPLPHGMIDLGSLYSGDGSASIAYSINGAGQVVGWSDANGGYPNVHAFLWDPGTATMRDLGTLGGLRSEAHGINDAGQVVGFSYVNAYESHAFLWDPVTGTMRDLGTLSGAYDSQATGINDAGQVVGYSSTADGSSHAFLWDPGTGTMRDLGTLPGGSSSGARGINNAGQVVGQSKTADGSTHAFLRNP